MKIIFSYYLEPPEVPVVFGGKSLELFPSARTTVGINSNKLKAILMATLLLKHFCKSRSS